MVVRIIVEKGNDISIYETIKVKEKRMVYLND